MKKCIPYVLIFAAIFIYIGCKSTNPVSPTNNNVSFKIAHDWFTDTLVFRAQPSVNVKVTYFKYYAPTGDTGSYSNMSYNWNKDTSYYYLYFISPPTGVYSFDFKGTLTSGGTSFTSTGRDTLR